MIFICYILATHITLMKEHSLFDYYFLSLLLSTALSLPLHTNKYDTFKKSTAGMQIIYRVAYIMHFKTSMAVLWCCFISLKYSSFNITITELLAFYPNLFS